MKLLSYILLSFNLCSKNTNIFKYQHLIFIQKANENSLEIHYRHSTSFFGIVIVRTVRIQNVKMPVSLLQSFLVMQILAYVTQIGMLKQILTKIEPTKFI